MPLQEIRVPHLDTYNFGVGVDRLSGAAMNQVVNPIPVPPLDAGGATQTFVVSRVSTTHDLQKQLGIDVNASYGCASFGAGVSARFSFAQDSEVHSASLFLTITASVHFADLSIADCVLTTTAGQHVDRPDIFAARYGNMFARACKRGGLFVGLMNIETSDDKEAAKIETDLRGSYGLFSADAKVNFSKVTSDHKASVYCSIYAEGGPSLQLHNPNNPQELLDLANTWMQAMFNDPNKYATPYQWTLSPISIAEGPLPLNQADIEHAQDVLVYCDQERATLLDQLNQLNWWSRHQGKYDWTGSATPEQVTQGARATQIDLDTVAACASVAINSPAQALMPTEYATAHVPPKQYPLSQPPPVGPTPKPGTPDLPTIRVQSFVGMDPTDFDFIEQSPITTMAELRNIVAGGGASLSGPDGLGGFTQERLDFLLNDIRLKEEPPDRFASEGWRERIKIVAQFPESGMVVPGSEVILQLAKDP